MNKSKHIVILKHIHTNPDYCTDEIRVSYQGIAIRVGIQTGNWHPAGKSWLASIRTDIHNYDNPANWAMGLGAFGSTYYEAITKAMDYAKNQTLRFPINWLEEIMRVIDHEYGKER